MAALHHVEGLTDCDAWADTIAVLLQELGWSETKVASSFGCCNLKWQLQGFGIRADFDCDPPSEPA